MGVRKSSSSCARDCWPAMALPRLLLLLLELALYVCCFISGIITAASVTLSQGEFTGRCLLYGSVYLNGSDIGVNGVSSPSLCYFVSAISVFVAIVCFSSTLYWVYTICVDGEVRREQLWMSLSLGICGIFLFFLLVTGCILKVGRDTLCASVISKVPNITRCDQAQGKSWMHPLNGNSFYSKLHNAEVAVWVNFFCWIIIAVLVVVQRKMGSEFSSRIVDYGATPSETEPFYKQQPVQPN